jgi:hypothetical protein
MALRPATAGKGPRLISSGMRRPSACMPTRFDAPAPIDRAVGASKNMRR